MVNLGKVPLSVIGLRQIFPSPIRSSMENPLKLKPRPATEADLVDIARLYAEAAEWMDSRGIPQWTSSGKRSQGDLENQLRHRLEVHETYVIEDAEGVAATVTLQNKDDEHFPGDKTRALYIHGLLIRRSLGGQGLGASLLRWAENVARERGYSRTRLDFISPNERLKRYYEDFGYRKVGESRRYGLNDLMEKTL